MAGQLEERVPKLVGSRADIVSKIEEGRGLLEEQNDGNYRNFLEMQPLDMESERIQRHLSFEGMRVLDMANMLQTRSRFWGDLVHGDAKEMSEVLLSVHDQSRKVEEESKLMRKKTLDLDTMSALRPLRSQSLKPLKVGGSESARRGGQAQSWDWNDVDLSSFKSIVAPRRMYVELQRTPHKKMESSPQLQSRLTRGNPGVVALPAEAQTEPAVEDRSPFSQPQAVAPRDGWDRASTADQTRARRMNFASPKDLRETSLDAESKGVLRSYSTSIEDIHGMQSSDRVTTKASQPQVDRKSESKYSRSTHAARSSIDVSDQSTPSMNQRLTLERHEGSSSTTSRAKRISPGHLEKGDAYATRPSKGPEGSLDSIMLGMALPRAEDIPPAKDDSVGLLGAALSSPNRDTSDEATSTPDYSAILTEFYKKHNPSKMNTVSATLKKYQGREHEMFSKLALKYGVPCPLDHTKLEVSAGDTRQQPTTSGTSNPFHISSNLSPYTTFAKPPLPPTPFSSAPDEPSAPKFGSTAAFASQSSLGASNQQSSSFSFGASSAPVSLSYTPPTTLPASRSSPLAGKSPRDILRSFYEQRNPSKLNELDKVLAKYQGNEDQLFRNLAKKYNLDPSYFEVQAAGGSSSVVPSQSFASPTVFGQPSVLGGGPSPLGPSHNNIETSLYGGTAQSPRSLGGFGQPSILGGGPSQSSFGAKTSSQGFASPPSGVGFGATSSQGFANPSSGGGFGAVAGVSGVGFGSATGASSGASSFGSLAQIAPAGGFGSLASNTAFGQSPAVGFGSSFGGPRR